MIRGPVCSSHNMTLYETFALYYKNGPSISTMDVRSKKPYRATSQVEAQTSGTLFLEVSSAWKIPQCRRRSVWTATKNQDKSKETQKSMAIFHLNISLKRLTEPNKCSKENEKGVGPLPASNKLMDAQAIFVQYQNVDKVPKKDWMRIVKKDDLLCRKVPADVAENNNVYKCYKRPLFSQKRCQLLAGLSGTSRM